MRGHIRGVGEGRWELIFDVGYVIDPETGKKKRRQKFVSFRGSRRKAENRLRALLSDVDKNNFVEPAKLTFGEWLLMWFETAITGKKKLRTVETYLSVIDRHLIPALGELLLQKLTAVDLERYFASKKLSSGTLQQHSAIIHSALASAERKRLVHRNESKLVDGKPRAKRDHEDVQRNCWEAPEAKQFLQTAEEAGPRQAAFYNVALETGMRKAELCGVKWDAVDFEAKQITVIRQLIKPGKDPVFGPPKRGKVRTLDISLETVELLKELKRHQAEVKMRNRTAYRDHGLVFTKEWSDTGKKTDCLGDPLQQNNLGQREFAKLLMASGVRPIKFHGMRHTCATLMLKNGENPKVVQERLGHANISITMDVYVHALPSMQKDAAAKLASLLR